MSSRLNKLEKEMSAVWSYLGFQVGFSNHFHDRFSDSRNEVSIGVGEFKKFMISAFRKYGAALKRMSDSHRNGFSYHGVFKGGNMIVPFTIYMRNTSGECKLNIKTVMKGSKFHAKTTDNVLLIN